MERIPSISGHKAGEIRGQLLSMPLFDCAEALPQKQCLSLTEVQLGEEGALEHVSRCGPDSNLMSYKQGVCS